MNADDLKDVHDAIWEQIYEQQKLTMQRTQMNQRSVDTRCQMDLVVQLENAAGVASNSHEL